MRKYFLLLAVCLLFSASSQMAAAGNADFENEFADATQMKESEAARGTDTMIRDTTRILHNENMAILAALDKLQKEIEDLKKDIGDIKDTVEGGN